MFEYLHFIRPWWGCLLPLLVLASGASCHFFVKQSGWQRVCDAHLLPSLLEGGGESRLMGKWGALLFLFFLELCFVLAMMGPSWRYRLLPVFQPQNARVIVLDLSRNMLAQDISPSRIVRARYKLLDLFKGLKEGQTGLVVFTKKGFVVSPMTNDVGTLVSQVPALHPGVMPVMGSSLVAGLKKAKQLLVGANISHGKILLVTGSKVTEEDLAYAEKLKGEGFLVTVYGVGTTVGGPIADAGKFQVDGGGGVVLAKLPRAALMQLGLKGGGDYVAFSDGDQDSEALLQILRNHSMKGVAASTQKIKLWEDQGLWFLVPILFFGVWVFRQGSFLE
jgi:Ca-activated chloride channel family protein